MSKTKEDNHYLINYRDAKTGDLISLKAKSIADSNLGLSFVAISGFVFQDSSTLINPAEEKLKQRFEKTITLHLSIYSIISIEEVGPDHPGLKFEKDKSNLVLFSKEPSSPPLQN